MSRPDLDHTIITYVNERARNVEGLFSADVVAYFGVIHPQYFRNFRNFIEEVKQKSTRKNKKLVLFLRTPGGSVETVERYVTVIRNYYNTVYFVVPDMAMSAGTIFCMSGDKIYMDYSSTLGPIDPQVPASDNSGYIAALGYLDKVEELLKKPKLHPVDAVFLKSLDLGKLALYEQARNLSVELLKTWLVQYKFKNWNKHRTNNIGAPVTAEEKEQRAKEIADALSDNRKWHMHGRALDLKKLQKLRLEIDDYSNRPKLAHAIRSYNDLLSTYADRMGLPFILHSHLADNVS